MHVDLLPRQTRALSQVVPLDPQGRGEAHQVGPGLPQQPDGGPLQATVLQAGHAEEEGLALPAEVNVSRAPCSHACVRACAGGSVGGWVWVGVAQSKEGWEGGGGGDTQ